MSDKNDLNEKQKKFCEEYILDWNATRAYQETYPNASYETSNVNGSKLLVKASIKAYIEEIQKDLQKLAGISKLSVLNKLKDIINVDDTETIATKDKLKALEVVNKMLGFNDPEKSNITTNAKELTLEETKAELARLRKLKEEEQNMFDGD